MRRLVTGGAGCIGADLVHCTWRERPDHSFTVLEADELSWKPRYTDFRDGLAATVEWYRNNELSLEAAGGAGRGQVRGSRPVTAVVVGAKGQLGRALRREIRH